jgi:glycine/D-amino acid oxidase-like deaminating enzyme
MAKRVLVIGSGIIGASIAWHLAKGGAAVTILDGGDFGGLATRASWGWINASWGNPKNYFDLRRHAMREWRRLDSDVPGLGVNWCGGLVWDLPGDELEAFAREHESWGYGIRRVNRGQVLAIEPNLKSPPDFALHVAEEGVIEPFAAARAMLAAAFGLGGEVIAHAHVKWLVEDHDRASGAMTEEGIIHADEIVIAAGAGSVQLLDSIGIKLKLTTPPGLLAHSKPCRQLLRGLIMSPGVHVRQNAEGRLVAGTDFAGADPLGKADFLARELQAKVQAMVNGAEEVEADFHTIGYRPTPADGFPAIGRPRERTGVYLAVTHSGVTLAPAVGLLAARELLEGKRDPLLYPYHPDRPDLA